MDIKALLADGEGQTVEFKRSFTDDALDTISAFANADGGTIFIGIEDNGDVCGVQQGKKTLEDWANRIQTAIDPRLQPRIQPLLLEGSKTIVMLHIPQAVSAAVSANGRFFKRVGKTNQRLSGEEIAQKVLANMKTSWDALPQSDATLDDLDLDAVKQFVSAVREYQRRSVSDGTEPFDALEKLELTLSRNPTRAAILLFGKNPQKFFPSATLKLGRFKTATTILDDKEIRGNLFHQVDEAMKWLKDRMETALEIGATSERRTSWEYPLDALREAIANAICHRTYKIDAVTQIRLYDRSVEFLNVGGLASPLTHDDLFRDHMSVPRNRKLQEAFFLAGLVEQWGTGTLRMLQALHDSGYPAPEFDVSRPDHFRLLFRRQYDTDTLKSTGLNDRQVQAVLFIVRGNQLTNIQYQELFTTSKRTATRELAELVERKLLAKHGTTGKGTYYTLF